MRSLQARLSTGLTIALVLLIGVLLISGSYALRHLAEDFVASRLEHDMDALLVALRFDRTGRPLLDPSRFNPIFHQPYSGHYYKLQTATVELRSRSLWDSDLTVPKTTSDTVTRYFTRGPRDEELLALARTFYVEGHQVVVAVMEDFTPLTAGLRRLIVGFALTALALLGLLILSQRFIVRQSLKPLEAVRRDIPRLARGEIHHLQADAPIEIRPLVAEINRLIELMAQRLQRSRHALGNLAHALKTPLTVLLQLAERADVKAQPEIYGELEQQTRKIRSLMERELKRARIAGAAIPGQRVLLAQEIADLVDTLGKIHRDKALVIERHIPPESLFQGERDDLLELLGNLLDNAYKRAAGTVRLTVSEAEGWQRLTIEDDGPGCPPEQLQRLTRRGARVDESNAGHGLGLAIVNDIIEQYGGRLRLGRSEPLGGFLAEVALPCRNVGLFKN